MASDEHTQSDEDPEIAKIEEADRKGKINIVKGIMNDKEVQQIIREPLLKETIKNSIIMACFLLGLFKLYEAFKTALQFGWEIDATMGFLMFLVGLIYVVKNTILGKKNGDRTPSRSDS